jgi:hypothetical protein
MSWDDYVDFDPLNDDHEDVEEVELKYLMLARETRAAWFITFEINEKFEPVQHWLPKSQCRIVPELNLIYVPQWLVDSNDLHEYRKD